MRNNSWVHASFGITVVVTLGHLASPVRGQSYQANLSCLSSNTVQVTSIDIVCDCPGSNCANDCDPVAFPGVTFAFGSFDCAGALDPDAMSSPFVIPACPAPRCPPPPPPACARRAKVHYTCNGSPGPGSPACMNVPAPGSGQATSVDLNCGANTAGVDATLSLQELNIPAVSTFGALATAAFILAAGALVLRRSRGSPRSTAQA